MPSLLNDDTKTKIRDLFDPRRPGYVEPIGFDNELKNISLINKYDIVIITEDYNIVKKGYAGTATGFAKDCTPDQNEFIQVTFAIDKQPTVYVPAELLVTLHRNTDY